MKILIRLAVAGFALLVAAVAVFFFYMDVIASSAIEKGASYALGVETNVGFVRILPLRGSIRISSLSVDNPPGFESRRMIELGDARASVDTGTLRSELIEVPSFVLRDVDVSLEKQGKTTNYGTVLGNLKRFEKTDSKPAPSETEGGVPGKRYVIRELLIQDLTAHVVRSKELGSLGKLDVEIPEIRVQNVGAGNAKGVLMSELTNIIMKAIFTAILKNGNLPDLLTGDLRSSLRGLSSVPVSLVGITGGAVADQLPEPVGEAAKQLGGEAGRYIEKGLGGFFGDKKKVDE